MDTWDHADIVRLVLGVWFRESMREDRVSVPDFKSGSAINSRPGSGAKVQESSI